MTKDAAFPVVLVVIGLAWLLDSLGWLPDVHWLWILGLAGAGVAILAIDGLTKSSVVAGPLLIIAGILSFLRQYYGLGWRFIIPVMLISAGALMLVSRSSSLPESRNFNRQADRSSTDGEPRP